jgi:hypothetical protein
VAKIQEVESHEEEESKSFDAARSYQSSLEKEIN